MDKLYKTTDDRQYQRTMIEDLQRVNDRGAEALKTWDLSSTLARIFEVQIGLMVLAYISLKQSR